MARPASPPTPRKPSTPRKKPKQRTPQYVEEGARLAAILEERKIRPSTFARSIDHAYYHVYRWRRGYEFTPENQAICCAQLGIPRDALTHDNAVELAREARSGQLPPRHSQTLRQTELDAREALAAFERTPIAATLTPAQWGLLRSLRFCDPELPPSVALYSTIAFALHGAIRIDEIARVASANADVDRTLAHKRRRSRR